VIVAAVLTAVKQHLNRPTSDSTGSHKAVTELHEDRQNVPRNLTDIRLIRLVWRRRPAATAEAADLRKLAA
jgi:hypothetical protein